MKVKIICLQCKKDFLIERYRKNKGKFCSHKCYSKNLKGQKRVPRSDSTKKKISLANSGNKNGMYGKKSWNNGTKGIMKVNSGSFKKGPRFDKRTGKFKECKNCKKEIWVASSLLKRKNFCSKKCSNIFRKGKPVLSTRGGNNIHWKGGITPLRIKIWKSFKYQEWRLSVYERDKFICQMPECDKVDRILNVHHIKTFSKIKEKSIIKTLEEAENCKELWDINNGITLCKKCHKKTLHHEQQYENLFKEIVKLKT